MVKDLLGSFVILFPKLECWNALTKVATIAAKVDNKRVLCRVSNNVLQDIYGPSDDAPMQLIAKYRGDIEEAARKIILSGAYEEDGSVLIQARNIRDILKND